MEGSSVSIKPDNFLFVWLIQDRALSQVAPPDKGTFHACPLTVLLVVALSRIAAKKIGQVKCGRVASDKVKNNIPRC
jgi:hypothetical protein